MIMLYHALFFSSVNLFSHLIQDRLPSLVLLYTGIYIDIQLPWHLHTDSQCPVLEVQVHIALYYCIQVVSDKLNNSIFKMINKNQVGGFFNNSSTLNKTIPVDLSHAFPENDVWLDDLYKQAMQMSTSKPFRPRSRVRRDGGYGCKKSGLGIFNFLLFLVVLLGLLNSLLSSAMTMIMINGENVSLLQVNLQCYDLCFMIYFRLC